jgi:hypothetical protein
MQIILKDGLLFLKKTRVLHDRRGTDYVVREQSELLSVSQGGSMH